MAKSKKLNRETVPRAQLGSDTKVNAQLESWTRTASQEQLRLVRRKTQLWGRTGHVTEKCWTRADRTGRTPGWGWAFTTKGQREKLKDVHFQ